MGLDLRADVVDLTAELVDIESVSGNEHAIADAVEEAIAALGRLDVRRFGNTIVARTDLRRPERVVIAGHLDTVPVNDNLPARLDADALHGLGSCDMKSGCAVALGLAASLPEPARDVSYVFYECEEVEAQRNGLFQLSQHQPHLLEADLAILMEPSAAVVEAGCQGSITVDVTARGERAHAARSWMGSNAIHAVSDVLARLREYEPRRPVIDGLEYHEGLNAVGVTGGVAGNVLPDVCTVTVNHRFAPDRSEREAEAHLREVFEGFEISVIDSAPGAPPGLSAPAAATFVEAVGGAVNPKFGWTDVARFALLGVPAVNFGPGDPSLAHRQDEHVPVAQIHTVAAALRDWLTP